MSLLDTIMGNLADSYVPARSRVDIKSAVHDIGAIHVEEAAIRAALAGRSGGWDAAEYGISAAEAARMLDQADTPEARAEVVRVLKARAVTRASLDTTTGKVAVMVVGEAAWHRLGVNVASAVTAADAIKLASLDWSVSKRPLSFRKEDGSYQDADAWALVRDDTQDALGVVGSRYRPIQNAEGFGFLDGIIGEFGAKFHTAGAIFAGKKVWMQCELPDHNFEVVRGDAVQAFATFTNPHDGSGKAWCFPTTNRIVCANTFRTASQERSKGLGIRHTGDVRASISDARQVLGLAIEEIDQFKSNAEVMVRQKVDPAGFFNDLLDEVLDVTAADAMKGADILAATLATTIAGREAEEKRLAREIEARKTLLNDILNRYESEKNGIGGIRGTAWAAFNAVTESADHRKPARQMGSETERQSRRFESVLNGDADELKQTAYQMLTARA